MFVGGVFNAVSYLTLETILKSGLDSYAAMHSYLHGWSWPADKGPEEHEVFSSARVKSSRTAKTLKCNGSSALALYPIIAFS